MSFDYIERIKQIKNEKKITNDELSRLSGIPLGTLSKLLAGLSDSVKLSNMIAIYVKSPKTTTSISSVALPRTQITSLLTETRSG